MTKTEILRAVRNHSSEIKICLDTLSCVVVSLAKGYKLEVEGEIDSLKSMTGFIKGKADEMKSILDEWPEG